MPSLPADLPLTGLLVALGGGLLIGIERERNKGSGALRALAGVRSFTLAALAGAIAQALAQPLLVAAGAVLILALIATAYRRVRSRDPGVTTEIALFITYLLGVAAIPEPEAAAAGAVLVAALLAARSPIHRFAVEVLSADELRDALILAGSALVLLPLLPSQPLAWLGGLNPRSIWSLAVVMMALQGAGYIAQRWLGARRGLALAGLAAGFVSSTAAIAATGVRVKGGSAKMDAGVASALFSTLATFILFAVIGVTVHAPSLRLLAPPLAVGFAVTALAAGLFYLRARGGARRQFKARPRLRSLAGDPVLARARGPYRNRRIGQRALRQRRGAGKCCARGLRRRPCRRCLGARARRLRPDGGGHGALGLPARHFDQRGQQMRRSLRDRRRGLWPARRRGPAGWRGCGLARCRPRRVTQAAASV